MTTAIYLKCLLWVVEKLEFAKGYLLQKSVPASPSVKGKA